MQENIWSRVKVYTVYNELSLQAIWDWVILFLVIYTAIFTPYVAAFLLNEPGYGERSSESYGSDPIVIIDLLGENLNEKAHLKIFLETLL